MKCLVAILCLCSANYAACASSAKGSSASSSTHAAYTEPICAKENGFYCSQTSPASCPPRTQRCTGGNSDPLCVRKTYDHCDYNPASGKFKIYLRTTPLASGSSRRTNYLNCLGRKLEHHFVTYRGLMYEFGDYGSRIQDPSDPKYEYRPGSRETKRSTLKGESSCTYEDVVKYIDTWDNYDLCSHNCQDFAKGLVEYLQEDCKIPSRGRSVRADGDSDLAEYIFSIAGDGNCTTAAPLTTSGTQQFLAIFHIFPIAIAVGSYATVF